MRQDDPVLGHLGLAVPDLDATRAYYDRLMPLVGFEPFFATDGEFSYRPAGGKPGTYLFFYPAPEPGRYRRNRAGLQHLAFTVPTRSAVRAVHSLAVELGSSVVHEPQEFPDYPPPYFATFWLDPNGFMLEAVCHHDRD
jgi:catechol 2,3-dioxygenase-like lactoylglutathione lyase family enzyme